ncbi:MAG: hypothetical protein WAT20_02385 [Ferruginibacter sp.]|nr:hypothetical protein [Chitinophagaceae bacterium]
MKIEIGEVFAIKTKIGFGFIQYVGVGNLGIEIIRVLETIKETNEISQLEVNIPERFTVQFVVKAALRKKILIKTGLFKVPDFYQIPNKARTKHIIRGEFLGWHIVDQLTLKIELKKVLSKDDLLLSPHGIPNDTLLIEYLENDLRLDKWM